jgi:hypothetical protein
VSTYVGGDGGETQVASGKSTAPGIGAVIADTGALPKGYYDFDFELSAEDTVAVGKGLHVEHRNAANGATLKELGAIPAADSKHFGLRRYHIANDNERIRIVASAVAGAASSVYEGVIIYRQRL